jgi:hypothetical protein
MKRFLKTLTVSTMLLASMAMHADDDPGMDMEDENGDTGGSVEENPAAPIDANTVYLGLAGTLVAFLACNKKAASKVFRQISGS